MTFAVVVVLYSGGYFSMTKPLSIEPLYIEDEEMEMEADPLGPAPRRYARFPLGLTASIPKFSSTVLIEIGMAVHQDLPPEATDFLAENATPITAPLGEALRAASEDPDVYDLASLQGTLPTYLRDALNEALRTDDIEEPVYEVLILKMVSAPY
ncbi:MAG: hypothetical protein JXR13_17630 [Thalassovita sp.]